MGILAVNVDTGELWQSDLYKASSYLVARDCSYLAMTNNRMQIKYAWYLDLTPNRMFSLYDDYPTLGKSGLPLSELHGLHLEMKEAVARDNEATEKSPPDHCWVCKPK